MAPMERDGTVVNTLLVALLEPHTGHLLLPFINYTLVILLIVLVATFASGVHSIHLVVLGFLALGLMVSINWFVSELQKVAPSGDGDAPEGEGEPKQQQRRPQLSQTKVD